VTVPPGAPGSLPPGFAGDYEVGATLRARATGWIALIVCIFSWGQAGLIALHEYGVVHIDNYRGLVHPWTLAAIGVVIGVAALIFRTQFSPTSRGRVATAVAVGLSVTVGYLLPAGFFDVVIPAVVWAPVLIAAATCEFRWIPIAWALSFGSVVVRHGWVPALRAPSTIITSALLLGLVLIVRRLHDDGLREAAASHARSLFATFHDALTGLPNRHRFVQRLQGALSARGAPNAGVAVLRVDLDEFGPLNRALGRGVGDAVLRSVADTLRAAVGPGDALARAGADDFLVLLAEQPDASRAERLATALLEALEAPRDVDGRLLHVTARVGVAFARPGEVSDAESLLQRAERAMSDARAGGRRLVAIEASAPEAPANDRAFRISQALRGACARGELSVVYQPIVHLGTHRVTKGEALVRWTHPELGAVGPGEFIPIAEANGTIHEIGDWVLEQATRQATAWRRAGASDFVVSVNRSPVQFHADGHGPHPCLERLRALAIEPACLVLELTEGVFLDTDASTRERLEGLRAAGIGLSLDDFGTGYSSIGHLHGFDLDVVKIDRRFVQTLETGPKDRVLCESIIRMAHALGLVVVAEGVETGEQRAILEALGCDYAQGYFFGRPMPAQQMGELVLSPGHVSPSSHPESRSAPPGGSVLQTRG
jgi:diguanylate cyclase (GGDEF)-like protein